MLLLQDAPVVLTNYPTIQTMVKDNGTALALGPEIHTMTEVDIYIVYRIDNNY